MVNVAVVGLGFMGVTHLKSYLKVKNARIAAICDAARLPANGDFSTISGNIGEEPPLKLDMTGVKATKDFCELLTDPGIDLIDLCVPTQAHVKLAVMALKAGKHVICEKPLARTSAQAREIVDAAKSSKGFFMTAMCIRFWPGWSWLKQAIDTQQYGRVLSARFRRVAEPPKWGREHFFNGALSGGALLDLHTHDIDFINHLFGKPRSVYSTGFSHYSGTIDHVLSQFQVACGAPVSAEGSWVMGEGFGFSMAYTVVFEKLTADFDSSRGPQAFKLIENGTSRCVPTESDGYIGELTHIVDSIANNTPPTVVGIEDGMTAVEICEAEEKSIRTGQIITL